jgi:hypothetical protein
MSNPNGATKPTTTAVACEALLLDSDMTTGLIEHLGSVHEAMHAVDVEAEVLSDRLLMWRDLDAALDPAPELNFRAMHLQLRLRGPIGVHPVYGDVLITGRTIEGGPKPLTMSEIRDLRDALAG